MPMTIDPVCEMEVDEATAAPTSVYQGQTYYFCAPGCKVAFDEDPQRYVHKTAGAAWAGSAAAAAVL